MILLSCNSNNEKYKPLNLRNYERELDISFDGIVLNKFRHIDNHYRRKITITEGPLVFDYELEFYLSTCWDVILIGDSVVKHKNSKTVFIWRNGEKDTCAMTEYIPPEL